MRFAPKWGFFCADRPFSVVSALIMRVTKSRVLGRTGIIRAIASVSPRLMGILEQQLSTNAVNF
jgi:hypothetical protein